MLSDEQSQLAAMEKAWLRRNDPIVRVRAVLDRDPISVDANILAHAAEAGLLALLTDDMGGSHCDLGVVSEAHGYAGSALPIADAAIACWLLALSEHGHAAEVAEGRSLYGVSGRLSSAGSSMPVPLGPELDGLVMVEAGEGVDHVTVLDRPRMNVMATVDLTRSWSRLDSDSEGERRTVPQGTAAFVSQALAVHRALDAIGGAARLLEMAVAYAGQREQFGAVIGSFQAVKHHCANMAVAVEAGRATLWAAAVALTPAAPADRRARAVAAAAGYAKAAASRVASLALQVHGGIGFTWEHDLHLFLRRIKVDEAMNGSVAHHHEALISS